MIPREITLNNIQPSLSIPDLLHGQGAFYKEMIRKNEALTIFVYCTVSKQPCNFSKKFENNVFYLFFPCDEIKNAIRE